MFDPMRLTPAGRSSAVEELLRGCVAARGPLRVELLVPRWVVVVEDAAHVAGGPGVVAEAREFAGLLEAGAGLLGRARAAHEAACREAAGRARALAAFARLRPAGLLDRPDAEVGAAAASRAAWPPRTAPPVPGPADQQLRRAATLLSCTLECGPAVSCTRVRMAKSRHRAR